MVKVNTDNNYSLASYKQLDLLKNSKKLDYKNSKKNKYNFFIESLSKFKILFNITNNVFYPKPKVKSSVIFMEPKIKFFKIKNSENLEKITQVFFNQRRKMLKKPFNQLFNGDQRILNKLKIDLSLRPQNLTLDTYYKLAFEYENLSS